MTVRCHPCGEEHGGLPDLGCDAPDPYLEVTQDDRSARTTLTSDRCTVRDDDGLHYYVRGVIEIPIHEEDEPFGIGAWVSQSRENFERYLADEPMDPTFGWLVTALAHHERTERRRS